MTHTSLTTHPRRPCPRAAVAPPGAWTRRYPRPVAGVPGTPRRAQCIIGHGRTCYAPRVCPETARSGNSLYLNACQWEGRAMARKRRSQGSSLSSGVLGLGTLLLVIAVFAAGMLVARHFGNSLPGCGPQSACAELEATVWGKVPGLGWPVSFLGLSYFAAALVTWLAMGRRIPGWFQNVALLGGAASLLFIGVMLVLSKICAYCLTAHLANLAFVLLLLSRSRERASGGFGASRGLVAGGLAFVVATVGLAFADSNVQQQRDDAAEAERVQSTREIVEKTQAQVVPEGDPWGPEGFTGRYRFGPKSAPIRIVMLTDYQCPDCYRVEGELEELMKERDDLSVSIKHFPMCADCNRFAVRTLHPNACRAARAAEAAGILGGDEAFFEMHDWLFSRKGSFTDPELRATAAGLGLDEDEFLSTMRSQETLDRVKKDVEEGRAVGLHYTPMIFVNGVEFRGWQSPNALRRTVEAVAATNPAPAPTSLDRPPLAGQKFVDDWKARPKTRLPRDQVARSMGAESGAAIGSDPSVIDVVVWGDFEEVNSSIVDEQIRSALSKFPKVRYTFRHYPVNAGCNQTLPPNVPAASVHPSACLAAQCAEAAGELGGEEAYWSMHEYLMAHWDQISEKGIRDHAKSIGLDPDELIAASEQAAVGAAIEDDCRAGKQMGLRSIPQVFIDGRPVPRAVREGDDVMARILGEAVNMVP